MDGAESWLIPEAVEAATLSLANMPHAGFPSGSNRALLRDRLDALVAEYEGKVVRIRLSVVPQWGTLWLDGVKVHADRLEKGVVVSANEKHELKATAEDYETQSRTIEFGPGAEEKEAFSLTKPGTPPPPNGNGHTEEPLPLWPAIAGAVFSAGAIGAGVGLWFVGEGQVDDADALRAQLTAQGATCPQDCTELNAIYADSNTSQNAAIALWAVGGAAAAGTIIYALVRGSGTGDSSELRVEPVIAPSVAGVQLRVGF